MSDEESFLSAIKSAPADDAPRLVYADWLDDQGRAEQAEVLRLEHSLRVTKARLEVLQGQIDQEWAARVFAGFRIVVRSYPITLKIEAIKLIREFGGVALAEAKTLSENLPARLPAIMNWMTTNEVRARFAEKEVVVDFEHVIV